MEKKEKKEMSSCNQHVSEALKKKMRLVCLLGSLLVEISTKILAGRKGIEKSAREKRAFIKFHCTKGKKAERNL
jgi:hypothetical protein